PFHIGESRTSTRLSAKLLLQTLSMNRLRIVFQANPASAAENAIVRVHLSPKHRHRPCLLRSPWHAAVCGHERLDESAGPIVGTCHRATGSQLFRRRYVQSSLGSFAVKAYHPLATADTTGKGGAASMTLRSPVSIAQFRPAS